MLTGLALVLVLATQAPQQRPSAPPPPRDAAAATPVRTGTASVSGVVVADDAEGRPIRRARVSLLEQERRNGTTVITDDAGRFVFSGVPAGRYLLTAVKSAWVTTSFGARRPGRPGTPITIADGQRLDQIVLKLARGGVITGVVSDETGRPLPRVTVTPFRHVFQNGARTLVPAGIGAQSDDRGVYRIYGLVPGPYMVGARNVPTGPTSMAGSEIRMTTDADIQRALAERGRPAGGGAARSRDDERAPTVAYAPVFYPGTATASQATSVTVAAGEERSGIDFSVALVPTSRVEGIVVDPDGAPAANQSINIISNEPSAPGLGFDAFRIGRTNAEGRFSFAGIAPGKYSILARATGPRDAPPAAPPRPGDSTTPSLFATTEVTLDGHPVTGLTIILQPGFTVSGKVQFSGTLAPPDPSRLRVQLMPVFAAGQVNVGVPPAPVNADGTFSIAAVAPGNYRLMSTVPGSSPGSGWTLVSAMANGRDTLDSPLQVQHDVEDAVLTFSDRTGELSGAVQDPSGRPAPEYYIVVFPADRAQWLPQSRRIRAIRPSAEGRFLFRPLPAGNYLLSAVTDIEDGEWYDPAVLQQLSAVSMPITLGEGEQKAQDIQVGVSR